MLTPAVKIILIQKEAESWNRTLEFIRQENIFLKECICDVLPDSTPDASFLEKTEAFLFNSIRIDTLLQLIRNDLSTFASLFVVHKANKDAVMTEALECNYRKISKDMKHLVLELCELKFGLNNYMQILISYKSEPDLQNCTV